MVERPPSKPEALSSNPSTSPPKKKKCKMRTFYVMSVVIHDSNAEETIVDFCLLVTTSVRLLLSRPIPVIYSCVCVCVCVEPLLNN
jgi:hypothetical protein